MPGSSPSVSSSRHEARLIDSVAENNLGRALVDVEHLVQLLSDALVDPDLPPAASRQQPPKANKRKPSTSNKKQPGGRSEAAGPSSRRIDDDDDEREADQLAASFGGPPPALPTGSAHLFTHTLELTLPSLDHAWTNAAQRKAYLSKLDAVRSVVQQSTSPAALAEGGDGVALGEVHLDYSPTEGPVILLHPPVTTPRPAPKSWVNPSHTFQMLLSLGAERFEAELGAAQGTISGFAGKQRSNRSWLSALAYLSSPASYPMEGTAPRTHASLSLSFRPATPSTSGGLPYAIHLEISASLTPAAFDNVLESALLAEAQRRLLVEALPFPARSAKYAKHGDATTIPFFFDVLEPAPVPSDAAVPSAGGEEGLSWVEGEQQTLRNPPGLNLDLLPFQQRTVKWLLAREGVRLAGLNERLEEEPAERSLIEVKMESEDEKFDVKHDELSDDSDAMAGLGGPSRVEGAGSRSRDDVRRPECVELVPVKPVAAGTAWAFEVHSLPLPPPAFALADPPADEEGDALMEVDKAASAGPTELVVNRLSGEVLRSADEVERRLDGRLWDVDDQKGGMLCEEMGLGKTIEVMALLILHPSPPSRTLVVESHTAQVTAARCRQVKATLIVSPDSLITQWKDELEGHAPGLRILVYDGYKSLPFKISTADEVERIREERVLRERIAERQRAAYLPPSSEDENDDDDEAPASRKRKAKSKGKGRERGTKLVKKANAADSEGDESLWWDLLDKNGGYDVVLCSYATLERDFSVAAQPKQRPRRDNVDYHRDLKPRSPLVMVEWWRIAMDEVQLSGTPRIEEMVSLLPRVNSLAVSGTPAKSKVEDLRSTLQFLRQFPTAYFPRLVEPGLAGVFERLFKRIATRTTKAKVSTELTIPPQMRYLVPIDLTAVELAYYDSTFMRALEELQFDEFGNGFELSASLARSWVHTLRQISTHVQIGGLTAARNAQHERRLNLGENLLSLAEVLDKMIDSNAAEIASARRNMTQAQIDHALLLVQRAEMDHGGVPDTQESRNSPGRLEARELLLVALEQTERDLAELLPAAEAAEAADAESDAGGSAVSEELNEEQRRTRHLRLVAIQRARDVRGLRHRALLLLGDWNFVNQDREAEEDYYNRAETLMRQMLARPERVANNGIVRLNTKLTRVDVADDDLNLETPEFTKGIQSTRAIEGAKDMFRLLAANGALIQRWRLTLFRLLAKAVEAPADAEENWAVEDKTDYEVAAEVQAIIDAHLQAYLVAIADRREILDGHRDQLAALDLRPVPKKKSGPAAASRLQGLNASGLEEEEEGDEMLDLGQKLMRERRKYMLNPFVVSRARVGRPPLKTYLHDLVNVSQTSNSSVEAQIATTESARLKKVIAAQMKIIDTLTSEAKVFDGIFNLRVAYFKEKQQISDAVAAVQPESMRHWERKLEVTIRKQHDALAKVGGLVSRGRFLEHMDSVHRGGEMREEDRTCAICFEPFTKGVLFACSHMLCTDCYRLLIKKSPLASALNCPTCREKVHPAEVNRIILASGEADQEASDQSSEDGASGSAADKDKGKTKAAVREVDRLRELNVLPLEQRREIAQEVIMGSWGTKIDHLIKHLLFLADHDRGFKAIVFSAFSDGLHIIQRALTENGIPFSAASQKNIRTVAHDFKTDESKRVFLLHGERESSGLTLTCAKYVFLLEPTVSPSFELQAVGRVDRMGQTQETQVFCLFSQNTIDESIVHLQVLKGTSIYRKESVGSSLPMFATNPDDGKVEGDSKKKTGDFVAKTDDLAALLFPDQHIFGLPQPPPVPASPFDGGLHLATEESRTAVDDVFGRLRGMIAADAAEQRLATSSSIDDTDALQPAQAGPGPASMLARRSAALARSASAAAAAGRRSREDGAL